MTPKPFAPVGQRIAQLRQALTQVQFAQKLGVSRKSVVDWEAGVRLPDGVTLLKLMTVFDADINSLLGGPRVPDVALGSAEQTLLALYRQAPAHAQKILVDVARLAVPDEAGS